MCPSTPAAGDLWTTRRLLAWIGSHLGDHAVHNPDLMARMLMSHVLGGTDIELFTDLDRPASEQERATLRGLVVRAAAQEPVQYLIGRADFFGRSFRVSPATLIPRTATETLIQWVLDALRGEAATTLGPRTTRIADLGTGSGCIGVTLARQLPRASIIATDINTEILELARINASDHGVADRIEFRLGPGCSPLLASERFDVIAGNLPYIKEANMDQLDANVGGYEPRSALCGGPDGLEIVAEVLADAGALLSGGGLLILEIDSSQAEAALTLADSASGLSRAEILQDEFGDDRFVVAHSTQMRPDGCGSSSPDAADSVNADRAASSS
jgi:release factor glutamine methyltransferase